MKCGIIGMPNIGKSTLFNCLSKNESSYGNFPFCTIKSKLELIKVPDIRLMELNNIIKSKKIVPTTVQIIDIAGLIKGAHKGEGLGNRFLDDIRNTKSIIHVIRCFQDEEIIHLENQINPIKDKEIIDLELQLKDLEVIEKKLKSKKLKTKETILLDKISKKLIKGKNIRGIKLTNEEKKKLKPLKLLTMKPVLYICNINNTKFSNTCVNNFKKYIFKQQENSGILSINAKKEYEKYKLNKKHQQQSINHNFSIKNSPISRIIKATYSLLNFKTFFTVSEKEIRAWTINKKSDALTASAKIHSDFKKGFICVEVIHYDDYIKYQSIAKIKKLGKIYTEGKKYKIQDGDILKFKFNV